MPDLAQLTSDLRAVPDQALQSELANPTGLVPSYLVLAEAQRRQLMRQAAQKQQPQPGTVMQDVIRNMNAQQPPPGASAAPAGMTPPKQGQGAPMPGAAPPNQMAMARGGEIALATGGTGDDDVDGWINKYSTQFGVDPDLARAVMGQESTGNQGAVSPKGATGLFQLMPGTAQEMGVDPRDPEQNVKGGIGYLGKLLKKYKGDEATALAAYNAGQGAVDKYGGMPPYPETINYVPGVLARRDRLKGQQQTGPLPQQDVERVRLQYGLNQPQLPPFPQGTPLTPEEKAGEAAGQTENPSQPVAADRAAPEDNSANAELPTAAMANPGLPSAPVGVPSRVAALPQPFNPYTKENIASTRELYNSLMGPDELAAQRAATIQQLQSLQQEAINRYHNPSPWEFLSNIAAGMGASKQLSLPVALGQGVSLAWQRQDEQRQRDFEQAHALGQQLDTVTASAETERQRQGQQMLAMLGQQGKVPTSQTQEFEKFIGKGQYGPMDPQHPEQAPGPGMVGIPDPNHPGFGVWVSQDQSAAAPKPTGSFEKDFLPGWAEEHNTTVDKLTGEQRKQALADFKVDPNLMETAREIAEGVKAGTIPPDLKGLYRYGAPVRGLLAKDKYDLTTAVRDWQNLQAYYKTLDGQTQVNMRQSTQQVAENVPYLRQLYQDWQATGLPSGYKVFNKAALVAATNLPGDQGVKARLLLSQLAHVTTEVGKMYTGGNRTTDDALKLAAETLQADWNPEQFTASLDQLDKNIQMRRNSWNNVGPIGVSPNSPYLAPGGPGAAQPTATPPAATQPPLPKGIPPGASTQYNSITKQWRYKPQGSSQWQILPQ